MLDIESLGTPKDCGTTHIAMPSFAFVAMRGIDKDPDLVFVTLDVQDQLNQGAKVTASTLAFWMDQAKTSASAIHIMEALAGCKAKLITFKEGKLHSTNELGTNYDAFFMAKNIMELAVGESALYYGNGPEFDMTIYSAASFHSGTKEEVVPWKFWNLGNVRSFRNQWMKAGYNYKDLEAEGASWAKAKMEKMHTIRYGIYPVKHDPAFDALVESYCVARMIEKIKI
ncbi:putative metallopeptidase [Yersinia phage phiR2-01]|uniref:Metallopeptidase n=1 Tax=Yersinia phage phiR2-01 TaxID=1206557 RepID=I7LH03_9CAUD|nr:putative metallopeptidase [Yersinia phage phiR2-01]CCI88504.1 putative metallopeptidase [Yersinia phage phiR2-01]